ncbi:MAG: FumA C-terminus/TtdB family hydratase beta subunit [Desulfovermiculus sp.]|nr:FumA C-terminus/TtdB family hydratase beta subunit [Desulfovermiculus sp.]
MDIKKKDIEKLGVSLLCLTATSYPKYYLEMLYSSLSSESSASARGIIISIIDNILASVEEASSLCQDTGIPTFHVYFPSELKMEPGIYDAFVQATQKATEEIPLRKNIVEPFTLENLGNNCGWGSPFIYFHHSSLSQKALVRVELKGFGGEIKSNCDWIFTSTESMEDAVLAYLLNTVLLSKGENCIPGFIGLGVGGYQSEAAANAKQAVFRELNCRKENCDSFLSRIENRLYRCVNSLGLGPMGKGGDTTTLGVYLERRGTHTAASSVAVSHQCWASRASEAVIEDGTITYITPHVTKEDAPKYRQRLAEELQGDESESGALKIKIPEEIDKLFQVTAGDIVYLSGTVCTARDRAHQRMVELVRDGRSDQIPLEILDNGAIYHCGPVVSQKDGGYCVNAAGPTTSSRFTNDAAQLIEQGIIKISIGKGTMGAAAQESMRGRGIYLSAVGGCAVTYKNMLEFIDVKWLDLGYPEAVWIFSVHNLGPLVVSIDSHGRSLMAKVLENVSHNALRVYEKEGLDPDKRYTQYPQTFAGLSLNEVLSTIKV